MNLSKVAERHNEWIRIAVYLGCNSSDAEDLVQDLYLKLGRIQAEEGTLERLMYQGKINKAYMFSALSNMLISIRRKGKTSYIEDLDLQHVAYKEQYDPEQFEDQYLALVNKVDQELTDMYWYDSKMLLTYVNEDHSIRSLARATRISPRSIHNTIKNVKEKLKHGCEEEYRSYKEAKYTKSQAEGTRRHDRTSNHCNRDQEGC